MTPWLFACVVLQCGCDFAVAFFAEGVDRHPEVESRVHSSEPLLGVGLREAEIEQGKIENRGIAKELHAFRGRLIAAESPAGNRF